MATFFRIVQAHRASTAMTGEGARLFGGRWNPPGLPAVYLADSRALAALEILVHAPREALSLEWRIIDLEIPAAWIESVEPGDLPADWRALPSSPGARAYGAAWLRGRRLPALRLPSAVIPQEHTLMLNPLHPDAVRLEASAPQLFNFDRRF
jgi:RES domain-containing protein